jgi:hypothetical protein
MTAASEAMAAAPPTPRFMRAVAFAVALVALADWLFYGHAAGVSVPIFAAALAAAAALAHGRPEPHRALLAGGILAAALLPSIEAFGLLSFAFAAVGTAVAALVVTGRLRRPATQALADTAWLLVSGPLRLAADLLRVVFAASPVRARWLVAWLVPLLLGLVFLGLFSAANPVLERWLSAIDLDALFDRIQAGRVVFWGLVAAFAWPFLWIRLRPARGDRPAVGAWNAPRAGHTAAAMLFGPAAILRSLVLFNALFAVQSTMDLAYLWGGVRLPAGVSYAEYAHRGAYPLIATALLAAAFVLAATRPGSETERSAIIRALVFAFVGQNVLLVLSSILRLDLYVDVYALTRLRVAAFVWMGLVAAGLILIVARIVLGRSNRWLITANAIALAATLYLSSFVNFAALIAGFNVAHSKELAGSGAPLDSCYLCSLGPGALPAIDAYTAALTARGGEIPAALVACRASLQREFARQSRDWRAWSFRNYRLALSMRAGEAAEPVPPPSP